MEKPSDYKYIHKELNIIVESWSLGDWETPVIDYVNTIKEPDFYLALRFDMLPSLWFTKYTKLHETGRTRQDDAYDYWCEAWYKDRMTFKQAIEKYMQNP